MAAEWDAEIDVRQEMNLYSAANGKTALITAANRTARNITNGPMGKRLFITGLRNLEVYIVVLQEIAG